MRLFTQSKSVSDSDDATLVLLCLGDDRDAFAQIVSRYQNLLCSLAYASLGDIKQSEDLAQEVFIEAWTKMDTLREPEKLKSWLCGILRFKVSHHRRKASSQLSQNSESIDDLLNETSDRIHLEDRVSEEQQEAMLWNSLNKLDMSYREPLILFYRQERSVAHVAEHLELSQEVVKQRLSRGRKLLKKSAESLLETVLENSSPGIAFTAAVVSALNSISPEAKASAVGAGIAQTTSYFKFATLFTFFASISGLISGLFGLQAGLAQSRTERERRHTITAVVMFLSVAIVYSLGSFGLIKLAQSYQDYAFVFTCVSIILAVLFVVLYCVMTVGLFRITKTIRAEERMQNPQAFSRESDAPESKQREYKSSFKLFGVPLIHIRFGAPEANDKPTFGWFSGGEIAYGLLFAWGGIAVAPVSVGIVSIGAVSIGAVGFGLACAGTVAVGVLAFGASAIGYKAYASLSSVGWESAFSNGFSVAKDAALGPFSYAQHVNNDIAAQLNNVAALGQSYIWVLAAISAFVIIPAYCYAKAVRKRMQI